MNPLAKVITRIIDCFYIKPARVVPLQTFRYAVCGAANVALGWVLFFVLYNFVFDKRNIDLVFFVLAPYTAAQIVTFIIVTLTGFWLNKSVAFKRSPLRGRTQLMRYLLSVTGSWAINLLLLKVFVEAFGIYPTPSQIMATIVVTVYSYLMQKYFTFRGCENE